MGHYKSNVRDLEFNLFEVLGLGSLLDAGAYGDLDTETVKEMLSEVRRLAEGPLAESFVDGDRNPPTFDPKTHTVTLPESFKKSVNAVIDALHRAGRTDITHIDMPLTPSRVWAAMNKA